MDESTRKANLIFHSMLKTHTDLFLPSSRSAWHYFAGRIDEKRTIYFTKQRIQYKNKIGFFSWLETRYKNGKIKRTLIAKSGSKKKAEARANRLLTKFSAIHND